MTEDKGRQVLAGYEGKLKPGGLREGPSICIVVRRYHFQGLNIGYRWHNYKMLDGKVCTPLDNLLGFGETSMTQLEVERTVNCLCCQPMSDYFRFSISFDNTSCKPLSIVFSNAKRKHFFAFSIFPKRFHPKAALAQRPNPSIVFTFSSDKSDE